MTTGGGFQTGDDFVAFRVNFDIPTDGAQKLHDLSLEIDKVRTSLEAISRGDQSFPTYLNTMTTAGNNAANAMRSLNDALTSNINLSAQAQGGSGSQQLREGPQGATAGMGAGTGGQRTPTTTADMQNQMQRVSDARNNYKQQARDYIRRGDAPAASPHDDDAGQHEARHTARTRAQHEQSRKTPSGHMPQSTDFEMPSGARGAFGLARNVMNEMGPGGSMLGMGRALQGGMSSLSGWLRASAAAPAVAGGETAGLLGGLGGALGGAAAGIGIPLAALAATQQGGEMYQGLKNLGSIRGGGAAAGLADEMQIRSLAMNPFINTEQARQIIMSGLSEGYSGKQFETVTQFMAPQPTNEPVLTPTGWRKMGELSIGDLVIGGDGKPKPVLSVRDWGSLEVFELTFQDGTTARSSGEHKWLTHCTTRKSGPKLKTVHEMLSKPLTFNAGARLQPRYRIPLCQPVQFDECPLELDPYLLGLLLGDGSFSCSIGKGRIKLAACVEGDEYQFTLPDGVTVRRVERRVTKRGYENSYGSDYVFGVDQGIQQEHRRGRPVNPLKVILDKLGLLGHTAQDKFIPHDYLYASVESRIAVLQGLIDTDGCVAKTGHASFASTAPQLVEDVVFLVRSLGGMASIYWQTPKPGHAWGSRLPIAQVGISLPPGIVPARLPRKSERYRPGLTTARRAAKGIVSIKTVGFADCRCISISETEGLDSLYVTANFTVTCNSNLKDMNMQVSDSVQLLRKNVNEGGQSVVGLSTALGTLKTLSQTGAMSLPELQENFKNVSAAGVNAGLGGQGASDLALLSTQVFPNIQSLKDIIPQITAQGAQSTPFMMMARTMGNVPVPAGTSPGGTFEAMGPQGTEQSILNTLTALAKRFSSTMSPSMAVDAFQMMLKRLLPGNPNWDNREVVGQLMTQLVQKGGADLMQSAQTGVDEAKSAQMEMKKKDPFSTAVAGIGNTISGIAGGFADLFTHGTDFAKSQRNFDARQDKFKQTMAAYEIPALNNAMNEYGGQRNLQVGPDADNMVTLDPRNPDQLQKLQSGEWNIRKKGDTGPGVKLSSMASGNVPGTTDQAPNMFKPGTGSNNNTQVQFSPAEVRITVDQNGRVTPQQQTARLNPHQVGAQSGYAGYQMNDVPPGWDQKYTQGPRG